MQHLFPTYPLLSPSLLELFLLGSSTLVCCLLQQPKLTERLKAGFWIHTHANILGFRSSATSCVMLAVLAVLELLLRGVVSMFLTTNKKW